MLNCVCIHFRMASVLDEKNLQQILEHVHFGDSVVDSVIEIGKMAIPEDEACDLNRSQEPVTSDLQKFGLESRTGNSVGHIAMQNATVSEESLSVGESFEMKRALDISTASSEESKNG